MKDGWVEAWLMAVMIKCNMHFRTWWYGQNIKSWNYFSSTWRMHDFIQFLSIPVAKRLLCLLRYIHAKHFCVFRRGTFSQAVNSVWAHAVACSLVVLYCTKQDDGTSSAETSTQDALTTVSTVHCFHRLKLNKGSLCQRSHRHMGGVYEHM